ncbi:MAG: hypothetical protein EOP47_31185 [Sphingobacteriaceae bacterium]|nr:MAG: hypothetical protein EOP47_31185 [Sphingobacteriaceae bacterium]
MAEQKFEHGRVNPKKEMIGIAILAVIILIWAVFTWVKLSAFEAGELPGYSMNRYMVYLYNLGGKAAVCGTMLAISLGLGIFARVQYKKRTAEN